MLAAMKAMILAAGRGQRMMPLTKNTPKPMLKVQGKPLIQYTIESLVAAGITELVINYAYLGEQIEAFIGDGAWLGASVQYSRETEALETGGGIFKALPLLGDQPFVLVNSDVWTDYSFKQLTQREFTGLAHLVMIDNPKQHPTGDYYLNRELSREPDYGNAQQYVSADTSPGSNQSRLTYAGIAVLSPALFNEVQSVTFPLPELLVKHMGLLKITGEHHTGLWRDIGTPERLAELIDHPPLQSQ